MHDFSSSWARGRRGRGSPAARPPPAGRDVVVFEKGSIGTPLACSHVSDDVWEYVPDDARDELLQNRVYGARFHVGGPGSKAYPFYKSEPVSNVIDRVGLDRTLADCAREAGADVRENHTVVGVDERDDRSSSRSGRPRATWRRSRRAHGRRLRRPHVAVRRSLGLPEPDELLHGVLAFDEAPPTTATSSTSTHHPPPTFFAWRIPAVTPAWSTGSRRRRATTCPRCSTGSPTRTT